MKLDNWLAQRAHTSPDRLALAGQGVEMTYAELELQAVATARRLGAQGVRRGATVALAMPASPGYAILLHALVKIGAVACPLDPRLTAIEHAAEIDRLNPSMTIEAPPPLDGSEADLPLLGEHDMDDTACRMPTGGTSGERRSVGLTYGNLLWSAVGSAFNLGVDPADRWLCCLPLFHVSGLSIVMRSAIYGTAAEVHDGFDVDRVAAALESGRVTVVSLVATMLTRLLDADAPIERTRAILIGGGPVPSEVLEEAIGRGAVVAQTYGLTEASSQVTTLAPADARRKLGSAGRPLLTTHIRLLDDEILVQGPTVAPGCADEDGWLHTGDLGRIDDEGFLYVQGRRGDVIVSGGENVLAGEVEAVLRLHPAVADVAVLGRPDSEWQEAVTAVVVLRDDVDADRQALQDHCAASLASFKVPKTIEFAAELPRNAAGKLMRSALR